MDNQSPFLLNVKPEDLDEEGKFICDHETVVVGAHAFDAVKNQLSYVKLKGVNDIKEGAFENCYYLEDVDIDYSLDYDFVRIRDGAFKNCVSLRKFVLPNLVTLNESPFENCTNLREIVISGRLNYFCSEFEPPAEDATDEEYEEYGERMANIDWSEILPSKVFKNCPNVEKITISGDGDNEFDFALFKGFANLKEIRIDGFSASRDFWREAISRYPEAYLLLPTPLYRDTRFLKTCWSVMNKRLMCEYGEEGYKYGKKLVVQKIKIENGKLKKQKLEQKRNATRPNETTLKKI